MINRIKKLCKSIWWGLIAVFSADLALADCHSMHGRDLEPDPEKVVGYCDSCNGELIGEELFHCVCGAFICEDCRKECGSGECLQGGCQACMYYNKELDEWFCQTSSWDDIQKGIETSECMAEYLGVAEVVISKKG